MKVLVVTISLIVLTMARPDVSLLPSGSYLPAGGISVSGVESSGAHISSIGGLPSGSYLPTAGIGGIGIGVLDVTGGFGGLGGAVGLGGIGGAVGLSGIGGLGRIGGAAGFSGIGGLGGAGGLGGIGGAGGIGGIGGVGGYPQDQTHVYFYAAPDDDESSRLRINVVPNAQRNTKIIFLKAPTYGAAVPEVVAAPSISEDKTLVYVLVKRPEHSGQINIPAGAGVIQTKPEVFFIKYKSQHDAEAAIRDGLNGKAAGAPVSEIGSESGFVRTLDSSPYGRGGVGGIGGYTIGGALGGIGGSHGVNVGTGGASFGGSGRYGPAGVSGPY